VPTMAIDADSIIIPAKSERMIWLLLIGSEGDRRCRGPRLLTLRTSWGHEPAVIIGYRLDRLSTLA
jgi:hypothetical protein